MNVIQALRDPRLLGALPVFRDLATWGAWLTFVRTVHGLPLDADDLERFKLHTGRQEPRPGGYPEAVAIVGVQSGKTRIAGALVDVAALAGEAGTHALLLGQDHRGAMRVLLRYAREPFETIDTFRAEVVRSTVDTLELRNGVSLSAYPCRPAAVRGLRACIVVIDELAFFTATDGRPVDTEMLRVARGRVATTGGKLIILSSPYAQTGALYELHRKHFGRDDSDVLIWQASASAMNPTLPADYLTRMAQDDPEAYRSEVLGEFRTGVSTLFDPDALAACVADGVRERRPASGMRYKSFADAASGSGKDAFTTGIAHRDGERIVLDAVRAWAPPFNPSNAIAEAASLLKTYGLFETTGDRYAPGFVSEGFRANGINYRPSERDRSTIYLDLLPHVNAGAVVLLDDAVLLREFRGLERRRGTSGRDRVDHRSGAHDDRANAAAGALVLAALERLAGPAMREAIWG
ncbi:MAG: hypothetical protein ABI665_00165 [Vicinamibacterales bacterium]